MIQIVLQELPDRKHPEYMDILVSNVIQAFHVFLSDTMALDYCGVVGKQRALVTAHKDYRPLTKQSRARKFLQEINEIEALSKEMRESEPSEDDWDIREAKDPEKEYKNRHKDWLNAKLKIAEMRRNLLNMAKTEDEKEEADAMNIFFVGLTREEFAGMEAVEVHTGDESGAKALEEAKAEKAPAAAKAAIAEAQKVNDELGGYKVNKDGDVEDW